MNFIGKLKFRIGSIFGKINLVNIVKLLGLYLPIILVLGLYIIAWVNLRTWKLYYFDFRDHLKTTPLVLPSISLLLTLLVYGPFFWNVALKRSVSFRSAIKQVKTTRVKALIALISIVWIYCVSLIMATCYISYIYVIFALFIPRMIIDVIWYHRSHINLIRLISFIITDYMVFRRFALLGGLYTTNFWFQIDLLIVLLGILPLLILTSFIHKSVSEVEIT